MVDHTICRFLWEAVGANEQNSGTYVHMHVSNNVRHKDAPMYVYVCTHIHTCLGIHSTILVHIYTELVTHNTSTYTTIHRQMYVQIQDEYLCTACL